MPTELNFASHVLVSAPSLPQELASANYNSLPWLSAPQASAMRLPVCESNRCRRVAPIEKRLFSPGLAST